VNVPFDIFFTIGVHSQDKLALLTKISIEKKGVLAGLEDFWHY